MSDLENLKSRLAEIFLCEVSSFVYPPDSEFGDLSLPLFDLAKKEKTNPVALAQEKAASFSGLTGIARVAAVGPYLNFYLDRDAFIKGTLSDIARDTDRFGSNNSGSNAGVMIEYSNANTQKEVHIGHLRNIAFGSAVANILAANGYDAIPVSYINDFGIHAAKTIWNWEKNPAYAQSDAPKGYLLGKCYSEAAQKIGDDPQAKKEVSEIMQEIEARQGRGYELWQVTRQWSIDYFQDIYNDLKLKFRDTFYESEFIDAGRKIVDELLAKGILKRSEGAIIADLEEYGLGVLPIIRSDGTALYPVSDLALASAKFDKYQLQESIYVVDIRQGLYFKQLFKILELMGYHQKMTHLPYEFLTTKNGMMASRTGNVITYKELKDEFLARTTEEIKERHADWSDERISKTAFGLSISAMKFEMVKVSAEKVITFDMAEALRFEGFTAAYLQYTGARICSLFKKAGITDPVMADSALLQADQEFALALRLAKYGEAVKKAGVDRDPSVVARYLFELAQDFNDYYHAVNIMNAEQKVKDARLSLVAAVRQILHNGFAILGLVYLEEM